MSDANLEQLRKYFEQKEDVLMAFVFGSQSKGQTHAESDWDIAVYFKDGIKKPIWEDLPTRRYSNEEKVNADCVQLLKTDRVDIIVLNRTCAVIAEEAAVRGIPLVIKDRGVWLEFMLRITLEAEDFRQTAREYSDIYWRSSSLSEQDRYSLNRRLIFLDSEVKDIDFFLDLTFSEYEQNRHKRREVERLIENIMNAVIDIAKIILASEKKNIPATYREITQQLGFIQPFTDDSTRQLSRWTSLRNILAHEYLDIRWQAIDDFLRESPSVLQEFIILVRKFIM